MDKVFGTYLVAEFAKNSATDKSVLRQNLVDNSGWFNTR